MSSEVVPDTLDLFTEQPSLVSVGGSFYERIKCSTNLSPLPEALEFVANADRSHYTDLSNSFLLVRTAYRKTSDGSALAATPEVGPVQNLHGSLFKSIDMKINNKKITPPETNNPYISWFYHFTMPKTAQDTYLKSAGWSDDNYESELILQQGNPAAVANKNEGLTERAASYSMGKEPTLVGKIYAAPHMTKRFLLPNCKIEWNMKLEDHKFYTMQKQTLGDNDYTLVIKDAEIWLKRVEVSPAIYTAHQKLLASGKNAVYPAKYIESRAQSIPQGSYSFKFDNVFQGYNMPLAVFAFFVDSEAKSGHLQKNPFFLETANLADLRCYLGSKVFPSTMYKFDSRKTGYEAGLQDTFLALDVPGSPFGPGQLNKNTFPCCFILGFDLTRDHNTLANYNNSDFDSTSLSIEGSFTQATTKPYTVIVLGLFNGQFELDRFIEPVTTWN